MADDREFEVREYKVGNKVIKYQVYYSPRMGRDRAAIEKDQVYMLMDAAGITSYEIEWFEIVKDNMFYSKSQKAAFYKDYPEAMRYICCASVTNKAGVKFMAIGNAAPDNVDMLKNYNPEMAMKRAYVRAGLLALGLYDINADLEFPDGGSGGNKNTAENIEEEANLLHTVKSLMDDLGWEKKDLADYLKELGLKKAPNAMTTKELQKVVKGMEKLLKEK